MPLIRLEQFERFVLLALSLFGLFLIWQVEHPPLMDLPQHVAQISLLHDLLWGSHPFAAEFRIEWITPYWLFYGPAVLLTWVMPALAATKLCLSFCLLAFIFSGHYCLRQLRSPPHLRILFVPAYFGLCWMVGLLTFLAAAPLVFLSIPIASRYAHQPTRRAGTTLALLLTLLYVCHALAFTFAGLIAGGLFLLKHYRTPTTLVRQCWPFIPASIIFVIHFWLSPRGASNLWQTSDFFSLTPLERLWHTLSYQTAFFTPLNCFLSTLLIACALLSSSLRNISADKALPLTLLFILLLILPPTVAGVDLVFARFSLFVLPLLAFALVPVYGGGPLQRSARIILILTSFALLLSQAQSQYHFAQRTAPLDELLSSLPAQQRILSMIDNSLGAGRAGQVLWHYPMWYQSEREGLVDYNFAQASPQVVRYIKAPPSGNHASIKLELFDWKRYEAVRYDYIIIGHAQPLAADLFKDAPCPPRLLAQKSTWSVYEVIKSCS